MDIENTCIDQALAIYETNITKKGFTLRGSVFLWFGSFS